MTKKILILSLITGAITFFLLFRQTHPDETLQNPLSPLNTPQVTPIPTPPPVVIDKNSNLLEEVDKMSPEDFSSDFLQLKNDTDKL